MKPFKIIKNPPPLLTTTEAAALLGVSTRTLGNMRKAKMGPEALWPGRPLLYAKDSVEAWMKFHRWAPKPIEEMNREARKKQA